MSVSRDRAAPAGAGAGELLGDLWRTLPAPLATQLGALVVIAVGAWAGIAAGVVAWVLLELVVTRARPADGAVRLIVIVAGPPLRYLLLLVAAWRSWVGLGEGPVPALLAVVVLLFVIPMAAYLLRAARARKR